LDPISLHPKQGDAFESEKKITLCCSGIQGGKTTVGVLWFLRQAARWQGPESSFIIGAPTYKILNQSTLPALFKYTEGMGTYHKGDQEFHLRSGSKVYIRTSTDPFSVEGIQNVRAIWLDEAGMCKYSFWVNLEGRAARTGAPIMCTTTPYGMNWPYQILIKPFKEELRNDVAYYEWLSIDNPTFPRSEYERQRKLLDPRTFRRKYMGLHERMEGLVYEISPENKTKSIKLPQGTRIFASVDWGFSEGHEFAISIRAITLDGFRYAIDEFKASGLDPNQQVQACKSKASIYGIELFGCDPARPDMISLLNKAGCKAIGFHEGNTPYKSVISGITAHTALIRSGKYRIFEDKCSSLLDEYETYHWKEFQEDKAPTEEPVGINDHLMDCERMLTVLTMNIFVKEPDKTFLGGRLPWVDHFDPKKRSKKKQNWESY
jgi:hypothetical protein